MLNVGLIVLGILLVLAILFGKRNTLTVFSILGALGLGSYLYLNLKDKPLTSSIHLPQDELQDDEQDWDIKPDPKYLVPPVSSDFIVPVIESEQELKKRFPKALMIPGGGWVNFAEGQRKVVVPGVILMQLGPVEYFAILEGGRDYESVLKLLCKNAELLHFNLLLARFRPLREGEDPELTPDKRIIILVQWERQDGRKVVHRAEDLVIDAVIDAPMPRVGWSFLGRFQEVLDPETGEPTGRKVLAASISKSIITTYRERSSMFMNPLPEGNYVDITRVGGNPQNFYANFSILPKPGTPVQVIFQHPTQKELKEIKDIEEGLKKSR
jgi:hypothetical protein